MKMWIPIIILASAVIGLCVWDSIYTDKVFETMINESNNIYESLQISDISNPEIQNDIWELNKFWTKKMDKLSISISRKDLQPVSDYLQYLCSSITNQNQEDAITYSRLLNYNITGLDETSILSFINLL